MKTACLKTDQTTPLSEGSAVDIDAAATALRAVSNVHRFMILCLLAEQEHTVGDLERAVGIRQPSMSQQLARLREDGIVSCTRDGKSMIYALTDPKIRQVILALNQIYQR
ncbi:MAG: metalloregulator ArsR/SmtB family transcription factor [Alphaproteobacteria bacterium]|nr:metalloregulator ArsR/SmtB family transcription factor [Alphaproteobacteria bacterium]